AVGISTKNCAKTIENVVRVVDEGLKKYFPDKEGLIIVSDGFSTDKTRDIAEGIKTESEKIVKQQEGSLGKGNGVKTIFSLSKENQAEAIALVDGDLTSIKPEWIKRLLLPVLEGNDLVVPFYLRDRYDGVITNQIAFPLTKTLYGVNIRQPIGGEYGLSSRYSQIALSHKLFPAKFGIDIFLTTVACCEGMKIVESVLGIKEHESTKEYEDPEKLLVPMFYQVVGRIFELISYYKEHIKKVRGMREIERIGVIPSVAPARIPVDKEVLLTKFKAKYEEFIQGKKEAEFLEELLPSFEKIDKEKIENFSLPLDLWVKAVYYSINAFLKGEEVMNILRALWQGRFIALVKETEKMDNQEAEDYIQKQVDIFAKYKYLLRKSQES
ncbi:MAG: glycosyltransferase, partial [Candidatus Omnitrophica bacterium]|nr:glycosyltransferase [Candidatus Omnitrophota bacterium]